MKALGWVAGAVALVLVVVAVYVVVRSAALVEAAIERHGHRYLGVPVEVDAVDVTLTERSATVRGLVVGNPPGFDGPPAVRVAEIRVALDLSRTSSEIVALEQVTLHGVEVTALFRRQGSNLQQIMDHLNARISAHERARETRVVAEVRLVIDHLEVLDARAAVASGFLGRVVVDLPPVRVTGIGREPGGASVGQVLRQVLEPLFRALGAFNDQNDEEE
jgi:hypothetical protein